MIDIAQALENIAPDYKYRGSVTDGTKESFLALVDIAGTKPLWTLVEAEAVKIELQQLQLKIQDAIQVILDTEAKKKGYESILSACSYAGYTNQFQLEGRSFIKWRGNVWSYCYTQLDLINAGERSIPTIDGFIEELPVFTMIGE